MASDDSSRGNAEFLIELGEAESLSALREAHSQQSPFVFKIADQAPMRMQIVNFLDKRAILDAEVNHIKLPDNQDISFKFNVGTEVYFVKTKVKSHLNRYYFDMSSRVIQLKRRKEPRWLIPKKWTHSSCVVLPKGTQLPCQVHDLSQSGIRLEVMEGQPQYKRDDIINIKFQIYKRGEVITPAIVRFVLVRPGANMLLGLEFAQISEVNSQRVADTIGDIKMYNSTVK